MFASNGSKNKPRTLMQHLNINDIVFHKGRGIALIIIQISGPFAYCIPVNRLQNPPPKAEGYLIAELVEVNEQQIFHPG